MYIRSLTVSFTVLGIVIDYVVGCLLFLRLIYFLSPVLFFSFPLLISRLFGTVSFFSPPPQPKSWHVPIIENRLRPSTIRNNIHQLSFVHSSVPLLLFVLTLVEAFCDSGLALELNTWPRTLEPNLTHCGVAAYCLEAAHIGSGFYSGSVRHRDPTILFLVLFQPDCSFNIYFHRIRDGGANEQKVQKMASRYRSFCLSFLFFFAFVLFIPSLRLSLVLSWCLGVYINGNVLSAHHLFEIVKTILVVSHVLFISQLPFKFNEKGFRLFNDSDN